MEAADDTRREGRSRSASVRDELARRIEEGLLPRGARLPSEPELADELRVSRPTLREALQALAAEGLVRRLRGSGTFVLDRPRVANSLDFNFGVTDAIRAAEMTPGTRDAQWRVEPAMADDAERLGVAAGTSLVVIDRTRTADDRPVVVSRDILVRGLLGEDERIVERLARGSIYDVLSKELRLDVDYGVAHFRPIQADATLARKLAVKRGDLLLYLWQVDYAAGAPMLLSHEYHLADAFDFSLVRRGPGRS